MTRTVFKNSMVANVWAQQAQYEGRSANGNFYFRERTIFSYGSHFPVSSFVDLPGGGRAILFTRRNYSMTTSGHKALVRSAIHGLGLPVFEVADPSGRDHAGNLREMERAAVWLFKLADEPRRKRSRDRNLAAAQAILQDAQRYASAFGVKWKWAGADKLARKWEREAREAQRRAEAERAAREAAAREEAARRRIDDAEDFALWQAGERVSCPYSYATDENGSVYMRIMGDELETSRGASVPLRHAVRVFQFVRQCRERGEGFKANGRVIRVGHFTVSEITPEGDMAAGCHRFTWERIEEAARAAGVADAPASDDAVETRAGH